VDRIEPPEPTVSDDSLAEEPTTAEAPVDRTDDRPGHKSSVGDYVRDLQLEYEQQQEEGKIEP
jgi:hypothetical protein